MDKQRPNYSELLKRYVQNQCTPEETEEVIAFLNSNASARVLLEEIRQQFEQPSNQHDIHITQSIRIRENVLNKINQTPVVELKTRRWKWMLAAAAMVTTLVGVFYFSNLNDRGKNQNVAGISTKQNAYLKDVDPGKDKATLTLADGTTIMLDDINNGTLAQQGGTKILKFDGKLSYNSGRHAGEIVYNMVSTPRGGQYQVELPDGSQVWLNAASTLKFPTAFVGKERRVEVSGEAYFEVATNPHQPFTVKVNDAEVKVLGTHFNIMAYADETEIRTTLLEGAVQFNYGNSKNVLKPGQQSQLNKNGKLKMVEGVDVQEVIAWKNGLFHFENAEIEMVMRQLARWYDVEVEFKEKSNADLLYAEIPRNTKLSEVLRAIQLAGSATFEIEGKKIIVKQ